MLTDIFNWRTIHVWTHCIDFDHVLVNSVAVPVHKCLADINSANLAHADLAHALHAVYPQRYAFWATLHQQWLIDHPHDAAPDN